MMLPNHVSVFESTTHDSSVDYQHIKVDENIKGIQNKQNIKKDLKYVLGLTRATRNSKN